LANEIAGSLDKNMKESLVSDKPNLSALFGSDEITTFLGMESCEDLEQLSADVAILGVPCATPYKSVGAYCAGGPQAIRAGVAAFAANLKHHDFDLGGPLVPAGKSVVDCGDLPFDEADSEGNRQNIKETVGKILEAGAVPIVLGGDDSIPIPMLQAFEGRGKYTILQIDAHVDWRDEVQGERLGLSSTMRRASEMSHIESIIQVGQRGIGSARSSDVQDALDWGVNFVSARDVDWGGAEAALSLIEPGAKVIVCFDVDALDPAIMPGAIGRAPGGLSYWDMVDLLEGVADKAQIAAMDIVEFMPERDVDQIGALTAGRIVATAAGLICRQHK
jgi:agmatinase